VLAVTEAAKTHLAQMLADVGAPEDVVIRIIVREGGLVLALDNMGVQDAAFAHEERTVLVLDAQVSQLLDEKTLDIEDTEEGPQLAIG
jgi:Fe-S cluster assembly iron-binding protein IscA